MGFEDEVWFSRLAQPNAHTWTTEKPLRLVEKEVEKDDTTPKAIACYGLLRADCHQVLLRFVDGRPISAVTLVFLEWALSLLAAEGKKALLLVWDNASWHNSQIVRNWIRAHNKRVKQTGGCRLLICRLPSKSPWLNNIEPHWVHGKRAVLEPSRVLMQDELKKRLCDHYECELLDAIAQ